MRFIYHLIDCSQAFAVLRVFREEFDSLTPGEQGDALKDIVHGIVIKPDQTFLEVFGSGQESGFVLKGSKTLENTGCTGFAPANSDCTGVAPSRSPVRTVFREVEVGGIEPPSANDPPKPLHACPAY